MEGHFKGNGVHSLVVRPTTLFVQRFIDQADLIGRLVVE